MIEIATITLNPRNDDPDHYAVGENSARLKITGGWDMRDCSDGDGYDYDDVEQTYTIEFYTADSAKTTQVIKKTDASGNDGEIEVTLTGLHSGKENIINVSIDYSYSWRKYSSAKEEWGDWQYESNSESNTGSLIVFTKNSKSSSDFWKNKTDGSAIAGGKYIDEHITQTNVNSWITQLGIWKSWKEQDDFRTHYDGYKNPTGDIGASWYNALSGFCSGSYTVSSDDDYIAAAHFIDLAEKVTTWT